ncbi:hypothetical protein N1031_00525 [Herbiconiux moechotypicola]|uniref:Uncharacterized protein n=1 Tax=Herbiconiux moechotypicola TaxID=637393 RepID=A0ABN3D8I6_9MICO|nr:hypothetical protein [Herbiconiux moechotypicola]MCS5728235.1 hypothetical protein [Herbiconiux moechotypicola]
MNAPHQPRPSDDAPDRDADGDTIGGEEVDSFDRDLEAKIHKYIASATPTDGPAPGA